MRIEVNNYPERMRERLRQLIREADEMDAVLIIREQRSMVWHYHIEMSDENGLIYDLWFSDIGQIVW